jgi:hypothetical protein
MVGVRETQSALLLMWRYDADTGDSGSAADHVTVTSPDDEYAGDAAAVHEGGDRSSTNDALALVHT